MACGRIRHISFATKSQKWISNLSPPRKRADNDRRQAFSELAVDLRSRQAYRKEIAIPRLRLVQAVVVVDGISTFQCSQK
jgi:hypothetical protein